MDRESTFMNIFNTPEFERLQNLTDASLQTEDGSTFRIHRMFLAYRNEHFHTLFCGATEGKIHFSIPSISAETLDNVLVYLYTGNIHLNEANMADLLLASHSLLMEDLFLMCRAFAVRRVNINNCLRLFIAAWLTKRSSIVSQCYRYVQIHFEEVIWSSEDAIGDLQFEALKKFLADRNLNVTNERVIWTAILRWTEKNKLQRLAFVPELVTYISLEAVDEDLASKIFSHPIVKCNSFFGELNIQLTEPEVSYTDAFVKYVQKHAIPAADVGPRFPLSLNFISFYRVTDVSHVIQLYLTYDDRLDIWRQIGDIEFTPDSLIRIGNVIYMFNSLDDRRLAFDLSSNSIQEISPMLMPRFHYRVVSLGGHIYALGGATESNETTSIVERYNPATDSWHLGVPMVPMILCEVVIMDGRIFAIGDDNGQFELEMMFQVYEPNSETWSSITAPNKNRQEFAVAVLQGHLYVIGGHNEYECLRSAEVYDLACDTWSSIDDLPFAYILPKAVVLNEKLIVYEDLFKGKRYGIVYPPTIWDPNSKLWEVMSPESCFIDIHLYQFCILEDPEILKELVAKNRLPGIQWKQSSLGKDFKSLG